VAEPEVGADRVGVAGARLLLALAVVLGGLAQLVVVELGAGEVGLLASRGVVGVLELLADDVEHEHGVDDPYARGEVLAAVVHVGVAAGPGAVAQLGRDTDLQRLGLGAGGERVELGIERFELAAEDPGGLLLAGGGEVLSGVLDVLGAVEQVALVDAHRVGVLVLDDGAVHERAEVAHRLVVQVAGGDALGDGLGELGGDVVHVGQAVGHGHRQLAAGGAFGDAAADRLGKGELAAQVVRLLGADAEVGAHGSGAVVLGKAGAGLPAVAKLLLLVGE
jgi:hypothetical protein